MSPRSIRKPEESSVDWPAMLSNPGHIGAHTALVGRRVISQEAQYMNQELTTEPQGTSLQTVEDFNFTPSAPESRTVSAVAAFVSHVKAFIKIMGTTKNRVQPRQQTPERLR